MSAWVIIPTAGTGERFGGPLPKPLVMCGGKAVIARTLEVFQQSALIEGIVLIAHALWLKDYQDVVRAGNFSKVKVVVEGGVTRTQSVRNGLAALAAFDHEPGGAKIVMIHDGVRPFVTEEMLAAGLLAVRETGAAIAAVPVKSTIKVVDPKGERVCGTLDRDLLREIQTPQVFDRQLLERAYREDRDGATDDAALVERLGVAVMLFPGHVTNIKITTPEDISVAEAFLRDRNEH
ncbi:MAG: 2-C-methyl-D-erythritol 4-phosphate cytidylyltransferase [Candidatus Omnitrophota bacterium]